MADDRRIALAALAVAAIVPIATLIFSNKHDSNQLHAQQVQADRAELRDVLDNAAAALDITKARSMEVHSGSSSGLDRDVKALRGRLDVLTRSYNRVSIRLGVTSDASRAMASAVLTGYKIVHALELLSAQMYAPLTGEPTKFNAQAAERAGRTLDKFNAASLNFKEQVRRFVDEANEVAGSTVR